MTTFKKFLDDEYTTDPSGLSRFAANTCKLVRITRRWWRGYKTMDRATVAVAGEQIKQDNITQPRWKLIPDEVKEEFTNFEKSVDLLIRAHCVFAREDDENGIQPLLTGGGNYAIDTANWPTVKTLLRKSQQAWGECADKWCTDDGYQELHRLLKEKIGEADYERVKDLIPSAKKLRRRFGLDVVVLPIRLAEDVGDDPEAEVGRKLAITELIEVAVRTPREDAAAAWQSLADQLVETTPAGNLQALVVWRQTKKDGPVSPTSRRVQGKSVTAARKATDALNRAARYLDPDLVAAAQLIRTELPEEDGPAKSVAAQMNSDDSLAVRVGKMLLDGVAAATSEAGMCLGVSDAIRTARSSPG
jgi:hypothetical protein